MPEVEDGETRDEFVSRCIPIVLDDGTAEDQKQAVAVCNSMWEQEKEVSMEKGVFEWLKEKLFGEKESKPEAGEFTIWKEGANTHWLAIYSNNYRDDDNPPEIISKEAHLDFVAAVDSGKWQPPELLYWHIPGARLGSTELVAFDEDSGMSLAAGTVDKGKESIIEKINQSPHLVSHGMPSLEIRRDEADPTIITRYRSKEISLLPLEVAANKVTTYLIKEGEKMQIPEEKLEKAEELGFSREELEAKLSAGKEQAEQEERESKELEAKETEAVDEVTETPSEVAEPEPEVKAPQAFTAEDVAAAVSAVIQPYLAEISELKEKVEQLSKPPEPEPPQEEKQLDLTPAASLAAMITSAVIGREEARVDGRVTRHDAPRETKAKSSEVVHTSSALLNTTLNQLLDPDGQWLEDLNLPSN